MQNPRIKRPFLKTMKRKIHKAGIVLRARPILRDSTEYGIPRIIFKTKAKGRRVIWKTPARKGEREARKKALALIPEENENFFFELSKRFPVFKGRRWEQYYDLPSLKDIFDGRVNRRMKKLLKENNLKFGQLLEMCETAEKELYSILSHNSAGIDLGPDQFLVGIKKGKIELILVDA